MKEKVPLFDLEFCNTNLDEALQLLIHQANNGKRAKVVVTPNTNHLVHLENDSAFKKIYQSADYVFADGFPIVTFSHMIDTPLKERVTGSDLMPLILEKFKGKIAILGGFPGEESGIKNELSKKYPQLSISVFSPSQHFDPQGKEAHDLVLQLNEISPGIIFVCLGMPKQEIWALTMKNQLNTNLILCVGAALDFILERVQRAPLWMQNAYLEWFWRLCQNPKRLWKRYLVENFLFIKMALREYKKKN